MLVEHRLEMDFEVSHVQDPIVCEMARRHENVVFNIDYLSVGSQDAVMCISLIGEPGDVKKAEDYFKTHAVSVKTLSADKFRGQLPDEPKRKGASKRDEPHVERKLWLTILGALRQEAFLWAMTRRFDVTFKIMQSTTGDRVSILSMLLWGPQSEVDEAVMFLRERGINVEFGEVGVSAPFTPAGDG